MKQYIYKFQNFEYNITVLEELDSITALKCAIGPRKD